MGKLVSNVQRGSEKPTPKKKPAAKKAAKEE